jgi:hypothetical protein
MRNLKTNPRAISGGWRRRLQKRTARSIKAGMSMAEIIGELPKLTHHQRRELCRKIIEMEAQSEEIALADEAARQGFAMLDEMEARDGLSER